MTRTRDIATLDTISGNSALLLGKSSDGYVGYLTGLLDTEGKIVGITDIQDRLDTLETITVDQEYNKDSSNAQSGTAVEDAFKKHAVLTGATGTAYMANESNGGIIKFTATDGSFGKVTTFDASDEEHTFIQICVHNPAAQKYVRLNFTQEGAFYSKKSGTISVADNEIVTMKDLRDRLADQVEFKEHTQNTDIHVTTDDKANWADKYTKAEVDAKLAKKADLSSLNNGLSLKADKAAVEKDLATKADKSELQNGLAQKADKTDVDFRFTQVNDRLDSLEDLEIDQNYQPQSTHAQSGTAVAEAVAPLATKAEVTAHTSNNDIHVTATEKTKWTSQATDINKLRTDLTSHTSNTDVHVTTEDKAKWNAKLDMTAIADMATKTELAEKANKTEVDALDDRVEALETKPEAVVDQTYDAYSHNAQSGLAVAEAIRPLATSEELSVHTSNNDIHVTAGKKAYWDAKAETSQIEALKTELQEELASKTEAMLHYKGQVASKDALPEADQQIGDVYNVTDSGANYAWSGTTWDKLSEDISGLANKSDLESHTNNTDIHVTTDDKTNWSDKYTKVEIDSKESAINERLETLEAVTVDQTYNKESANAQSGTAVAQAIQNEKVIKSVKGTAYMSNEENGGLIKFTKRTGEFGKVTTYDASDSEGTYVQIVASNADSTKKPRINFTLEGAYYAKDTGATAIAENELVTKKDIQSFANSETLSSLTERVETLEKVKVDQTYNEESSNAQSGTAVAEAIKDFATKEEVALKADQTTVDELDTRVETLEGVTVDQTYNGESTNAQSGTAVAEAIKDFATKEEVNLKANQTEVNDLSDRVETLEGIEVDQTYNKESANAQSGTAVAQAINQQRVIETDNGTSYMSNESNGGIIKFTKSTGDVGKVTVYDGSDDEKTYVQISAYDAFKSSQSKINLTVQGAYYTTKPGAVAVSDNEILTRKDIKGLSTDTALQEHIGNTDIHVTKEKQEEWDAKLGQDQLDILATKEEVAQKADNTALEELGGRVDALEAIEVDQTYQPESSNAQSGTAVADAIKDLANKSYVADMIRKNTAHFRGSWETYADIPTDSNLYPVDTDGNRIPQKNDFLVVLRDENHEGHTWEYRYTGVWETNNSSGWTAIYEISDSPLTQAQLDAMNSGITAELVEQIGQKANQSEVDSLTERVESVEGNIETLVDQEYNAESSNAQSGTAVAQAIAPLATKEELAEHAGNTDIHVTTDEKAGWNDKYTKTETDEKLALKSDTTYVDEGLRQKADRTYVDEQLELKADMQSMMDGLALKANKAETEAALDTKADKTVMADSLARKADLSYVDDNFDRVDEALEEHKADHVVHITEQERTRWNFNSGDAADIMDKYDTHLNDTDIHVTKEKQEEWTAKVSQEQLDEHINDNNKHLGTISGEAGSSLMFNEDDGGGIRYTKTDESGSLIAVNDGLNGVYAQVSAHTKDKAQIVRLNVNPEGIYYTKNAPDNTVTADNEIVTKKELSDAISTLPDLATKEELTQHTSNHDIHVTAEKKAYWDAKVEQSLLEATKAELQEDINKKVESVLHYKGQVDTKGELPGADQLVGDVWNVEDTGANFAWNGTSWDKLSEDLSGFATKNQLEVHTNDKDIHVTTEDKANWSDKYTKAEIDSKESAVNDRLETLEAIEVDQSYNAKSTNAQSGTAVAQAIYQQRVIEKNGNTSYLSNEQNGPVMKFTKSTGDIGKVTLFDGSDSEGTYVQIVASNQDKSNIAKINFTTSGAYYSTSGSGAVATSDNELLTRKDIKDLAQTDTVTSLTERVEILEAVEVDQTYNAKSSNAQSGTAVAGAIKDFATQSWVTDMIRQKTAHFRGSWDTYASIPTDPTQYPQDVDGNTTPQKGDYIVVLHDENHEGHTWEYRYTGVWETNGVSGWTAIYEISDSPLTQAQMDAMNSGITAELVQQIPQKANQTDLDSLEGRVDTLEGVTVDQSYNGESTNAQSGTAVAEAIKDFATKAEVALKADQTEVDLKANQTEVDLKANQTDLDSLEGRVETLEGITVDQSYNGESTNAQSGTAVAEAIKDFATKAEVALKADQTEVALKANQTDLDSLEGRVETLEGIEVDQTYNKESTNAQSGTAVAEAIQQQRVIQTDSGTAYMSNETSGGVIKFTKSTGEFGKVTLFDGSDSEGTYVQIVASNEDKSSLAKLNFTLRGAYYSKESGGAVAVSDNEIVTKKDIKDFATQESVTGVDGKIDALGERVETLEAVKVDQSYYPESSNAQSGKAVAEALLGTVSKEELTTHINDEDVHVTAAKKAEWDAKLDQAALDSAKAEIQRDIDAKVESVLHYKGQVDTESLLPNSDQQVGDVYNVEDTGANYAWSGTSWDKLSETISGFVSQSDFEAHRDDANIHVTTGDKERWNDKYTQSEVDEKISDVTNRLTSLESVTVDQTYNAESENAQSGTAVAEALVPLATKEELSSHTSNTGIHVTSAEKEQWNAKLDTEDLADLATKEELQSLDTRVETLEGITVDQEYNKESTNAQSGTAVAQAIQNEKVIESLGNTSYMANETSGGIIKYTKSSGEVGKVTVFDGSDTDGTYVQIVAHNQDKSFISKLNFTVTGAYYSKEDTPSIANEDNEIATKKDLKELANNSTITDLSDRVTALEEKPQIYVDQTYSATSSNAQSGKAVAGAIENLATKEELTAHTSDNTKHLGTISGENGTSLIFNEVDGGGIRYTKTDESGSLIAVNDGLNGVYAQVSAHTKDKAKITRLNVNPDGIYYTKNGADNTVTAENEIVTKADIQHIASDSVVSDLTDRVKALEGKPEITVDQTYNQESSNAQSGTAVAEAVKDLATKSEVAEKAAQSDLDTLGGRVDALEAKPEITIDQTYNGESTNAQSGTAVTEAIAPLATKAELTAHTSDTDIHVTAEKKTEWDAKVDTTTLQSTKTELEEMIAEKIASVFHYKGQVATEGELPGADQETGDVWNVENTGANYVWNGTAWDKLSEDISGLASKAELQELDTRVEILESKPDITIDQTYSATSSNAQSGKAVAEAVSPLASKTEVEAVKVTLTTDESEPVTFNSIKLYSKDQVMPELGAREKNVLYLQEGEPSTGGGEVINVDQEYNEDSANAQSGVAVSQAIEQLYEICRFYDGLNTWDIEGLTNLGLYNFSAQTPLDKSVATSQQPCKVLWFQLGGSFFTKDSYIQQMQIFCRAKLDDAATLDPIYLGVWQQLDGEWKRICTSKNSQTPSDGATLTYNYLPHLIKANTPVRFCPTMHRDSDWPGPDFTNMMELNVETSASNVPADTFLRYDTTSGDHAYLVNFKLSMLDRGSLKLPMPTIDQTYNSKSTNAQSGTAVAQAVAENKVTISTDEAEPVTFNTIKLYSKGQAMPELESREENVLYLQEGETEDMVVDQTYNAQSTNPQSGTAVAGAIKDLATKSEVNAVKVTVDQTYNASSTNPQSGKAVASAISGKANSADLVKIATDDGAEVVFKSIKFYSSSDKAPALADREEGVLYLIGE